MKHGARLSEGRPARCSAFNRYLTRRIPRRRAGTASHATGGTGVAAAHFLLGDDLELVTGITGVTRLKRFKSNMRSRRDGGTASPRDRRALLRTHNFRQPPRDRRTPGPWMRIHKASGPRPGSESAARAESAGDPCRDIQDGSGEGRAGCCSLESAEAQAGRKQSGSGAQV